MKQLIFSLAFLGLTTGVSAQIAKEEIQQDVHRSGSNQLAYPGPKQVHLSDAPKGKKPFYISHYGRHGSRFLIEKKDYDFPYQTLAKADSAGKLTALGKSVLERVTLLREESDNRRGELTPLGALQHQQIAKRMAERFPEVFEGDPVIDAKSTVVIRCILSMENALLQLLAINPKLHIRHDASYHDMYYMNLHDNKLKALKMDSTVKEVYREFTKKYERGDALMSKLFNDMEYVKQEIQAQPLANALFNLASNIQNTELRKKITLYDIFTDEELYCYWKMSNAWWYINYGGCTLNGGTQPYSQRNLLRKIIEEADSCIRLDHPGATLRFGHETMVLPLTCLLDLNGYGMQTDNLDALDRKGWINFNIFPMAANIQFIFYRSNPQDQDVLVKVLLNENEAELPVKSKEKPYYRWSDVREYYLEKLNAYHD
ncbi:MAG: histidine-type phosphatase [Prevotella sp.]|nr:histidine-type phosphatase [Prevotella sp.]